MIRTKISSGFLATIFILMGILSKPFYLRIIAMYLMKSWVMLLFVDFLIFVFLEIARST